MNIKLRTWNCPLITFLAGWNTIKVYNRGELDQLKEIVAEVGLLLNVNWDYIKNNTYFMGYACIEYNNGKGVSYYMDEQESIDWYGAPPIEMKDIFE